MNVKRAQYVTKNIELNQEFYSCFPQTKLEINQIFNSHHTGSPLWDLSSPEVTRLESSYNTKVKMTFDLPFDAHRYLIQPISSRRHISIVLMKRFMSFISQIKMSSKQLPKQMLKLIRTDA